MRFRNAFTLIELLVVLGIIAILAALLFPVFAGVRRAANQTACISNFKQHSLAIIAYYQDYDEVMPIGYYDEGSYTSPPAKVLYQFLQPYMKNTQIYRCPADPADDDERATVDMPPFKNNSLQREFNIAMKDNFGYNWQYLCPVGTLDTPNNFSIPTPVVAIGKPAETILGVDTIWTIDQYGHPIGGGNGSADPPCRYYSDKSDSFPAANGFVHRNDWWGWSPHSPQYGDNYGFAWFWHGERTTVVYCDGHAKSLNLKQLSAGCDVQNYWGGYITDRDAYIWDLQ